MALKYKCGAEFLPSPLASKAEFALAGELPFVCKGQMTAVAVAVVMRHAVAFLGTATGEVRTPFCRDSFEKLFKDPTYIRDGPSRDAPEIRPAQSS